MDSLLRSGIVIAMMAMVITAQAAEEEWVSTTNDCRVFAAKPADNSKVTWSGKCVDGFAEGTGTLSWPNGNRYEGDLYAGTITGKGRFYWANGDWYQGELKNGRREGNGVQYYSCSGSYQGQFHNGLMEGVGILVTANGNRYEGQFLKGVIHGLGVRQYADGSRFEGEFQYNHEEGIGSLTLANRARYEGEFKKGKPEGVALVTYPNGDVYEGAYVDGRVDGRGIVTKRNGERDVGFFKDNEKGVLKLISNIGPPLYESCSTFCSTTSLSCGSAVTSAITPDSPNYEQRLIDSAAACGREMQLCQTRCEKHNPTVQDISGVVLVGEIDDPASPGSPATRAEPGKEPRKSTRPLVDFAAAQFEATSEIRARLAKMRQQLEVTQAQVASMPRLAGAESISKTRSSAECGAATRK